ncbi:hypothetical protein [Kibdelosporangium aridum]|nr:hypothetical protein [Kibdelosporangium aridum]
MVWWQAALWALAGGVVVEGLEFAALQRRHHKWPWEVDAEVVRSDSTAAGPLGYFLGELVRLATGGILGAALAGQITGPLAALAIGAAAPAIAGHLGVYVPLPPAAPQANPATTIGSSPDDKACPGNNGSLPPKPDQPGTPASEPLPQREETA